MSKYTVITLNNEGKFISLHTEDKDYHISGAFQINAAMLAAFLSNNDEAFYDFDLDFALHMYRISDSSVSVHLTWINDMRLNAFTQSFILPVAFFKRVLAGKTVTAVVDNHFNYYDPDVAREYLFAPRQGVIKAYCFGGEI